MMLENPATAIGMTAASAPPVMMASANPNLIALKASPTAWDDVAQAVITGRHGPCALKRIAMFPAAMLAIIIVIKNGDIFLGPFLNSFSHSVTNVLMPPMPDP